MLSFLVFHEVAGLHDWDLLSADALTGTVVAALAISAVARTTVQGHRGPRRRLFN